MVRNDNTPDDKKYLGIISYGIRIPDNQSVLYYNQIILAKDVPAYYQNNPILFHHYSSYEWIEKKKEQLSE